MPLYKYKSEWNNAGPYFVGVLWDDGAFSCTVCGTEVDIGSLENEGWPYYKRTGKHFREFHEDIWAAVSLLGGKISWTRKDFLNRNLDQGGRYIEVDLSEDTTTCLFINV